MGRPESPTLATTDDILAALIGIRICVAVIADRSGKRLTGDDWQELHEILNLANRIQDDHLTLRALVSAHYQRTEL